MRGCGSTARPERSRSSDVRASDRALERGHASEREVLDLHKGERGRGHARPGLPALVDDGARVCRRPRLARRIREGRVVLLRRVRSGSARHSRRLRWLPVPQHVDDAHLRVAHARSLARDRRLPVLRRHAGHHPVRRRGASRRRERARHAASAGVPRRVVHSRRPSRAAGRSRSGRPSDRPPARLRRAHRSRARRLRPQLPARCIAACSAGTSSSRERRASASAPSSGCSRRSSSPS